MGSRSEGVTRTGVRGLELLLIVAAGLVLLATVVVPVLSPSGLGWVNTSTCGGFELCGEPVAVTAEATFVDGRWPYNDVPATGSIYDFSGPIQIQVNAYANWSERPVALLLASDVLWGLIAFGILMALLFIVRSLRVGDPFNRRNARIVLLIAILVGIGGELAVLLNAWGTSAMLSQPGISGNVVSQASVTLLPVACGLVIAVFAEIFRRGALMREDVEGLV